MGYILFVPAAIHPAYSSFQAGAMNVMILGAGVVGFQLAQQLVNEGKNVVVIEKDPERAKYVSTDRKSVV